MDTLTPAPPDVETLIAVDPERHSGAPCFAGTRVPVQDLFDFLRDGGTLTGFLTSFPTVERDQAVRVLRLAERRLLAGHEVQTVPEMGSAGTKTGRC